MSSAGEAGTVACFRRSAAVIVVLLAAACHSARAQAPAASAESAAVRQVVDRYLYGLKHNQVDSLRAAFWPDAKLLFVRRDGTLGQLTQPEWYAGFAASAGKEEVGELGIAGLDVTRDIAAVKVVETYPRSVYIDYLNLVKVGGQWRIVNKIYTSYPR
jgi:hypothetical protein